MKDLRSIQKVMLKNAGYKLSSSRSGKGHYGISLPQGMTLTKRDRENLSTYLSSVDLAFLDKALNLKSIEDYSLAPQERHEGGWKFTSIFLRIDELNKLDAISKYYGISRSACVRLIVRYFSQN